ncbi:MAG: hypothetical protein GYB17_07785 [Gammaproteobacteria bacterium]|nr:hypothetical protein [Gammaproteobacteria bacterium]
MSTPLIDHEPLTPIDGTPVSGLDDLYVRPPGHLRRMIETLLMTVIFAALGQLLMMKATPMLSPGVPWWLLVAPLLCGLRYGSGYGTLAAVVGSATAFWGPTLLSTQPPGALAFAGAPPLVTAFGLALVGLVSGEMCSRLRRRLDQMHTLCRLQLHRHKAFLRHYHVLRVSHDQLTERLAAAPFTLRDTLIQLERDFAEGSGTPSAAAEDQGLQQIASELVTFIALHSRVQRAALIQVADGKPSSTPLAWLGSPGELDLEHPMIQACLERGQLVSLRDVVTASLDAPVAVIPLIDLDERIHALLLVLDLPFIDMDEGQMQLLAIIGASLGEMIARRCLPAPSLARSLEQWIRHARHQRLPSLIVALDLPPTLAPRLPEIVQHFDGRRRSIDEAWPLALPDGHHRLLILMPLAGPEAGRALQQRLSAVLKAYLDDATMVDPLNWKSWSIDGSRSSSDLLDALWPRGTPHAVA